MNRVKLLCACAIVLPHAAYASAAKANADVFPTCQMENINPTTTQHLRMNRIDKRSPSANREPPPLLDESLGAEVNGGKILGYTRITVDYRSCGGTLRNYNAERRNSIKRFFLGKHAQKVLQLSTSHRNVEVVAPLASISRESGKQGEDWTTEIENGRVLLPYFRADENSEVRLEANLKSTREYNSSIASGSIEILQKATALINPTAPLITKANEGRFRDAANFLDSAIDGLLKVSIDETAREGFPLANLKGRTVLAVITLHLPMANNVYASNIFPDQPIGQWVVYAERFVGSVLGDVDSEGRLVKSSTSPGAILDFEVDDNKTLREQLAGTSNVASARDELVGSENGSAPDAARKLCRAVTAEAIRIGLTPTDADAAAWAYFIDLALPDELQGAESGCKELEHYPA